MSHPESNPTPDKNGNFFNKNPLVTFILFSIIVIVLFKAVIGDESELASKINGQNVTRTQEITYADLKRLIQNKQVEKVSIGQTYIRAIGNDSNGKLLTLRVLLPLIQLLYRCLTKNRLITTDSARVTGLPKCSDGFSRS